MTTYITYAWSSDRDQGYQHESTSLREAMRHATAEARQLGGRADSPKARPMYRTALRNEREIARWALDNTDAGVVVYRAIP